MKKNYVFKIDVVQGDGDNALLRGTGPANAIAETLDGAIEQIIPGLFTKVNPEPDLVFVFNVVAITVPSMGYGDTPISRLIVPQ